MKKYKHLTLDERYRIYAFKKSGFSNTAIAKELGVDKATIGGASYGVISRDAAIVRSRLTGWLSVVAKARRRNEFQLKHGRQLKRIYSLIVHLNRFTEDASWKAKKRSVTNGFISTFIKTNLVAAIFTDI